MQKGAPRSKINIGVPLYGRTFKLPSGHSNELIGCPASGAGPAGTFTREAGFMSWYEVRSYKLLNSIAVFVCLFDLIIYVPSTIFQLNRDVSSWMNQY